MPRRQLAALGFLLILVPFAVILNSFAQIPAGPGMPVMQPAQFGPWNRDLDLYESRNGIRFSRRGTFVERAGVPCLVRDAELGLVCVFQWFPFNRRDAFDQIALVVSEDDGETWSDPEPVAIENMPENLHRAFDPTLVILEDGRFRLYFSSERVSRDRPRGNRAIFSAVSEDALTYEFEPGQRFGFDTEETYDVSVVRFKGVWHLFCPIPEQDGEAYHAVSRDGLNFTRVGDVAVAVAGSWIGNAVANGREMRFYGSGREGVWCGVSKDGNRWQLEEAVELDGGDPSIAAVSKGKWIAVTTGDLRQDAALGPPR